jgi:alkylation response protein AidB-like acyl-CoA dehydrogenase
MIKLMGTELNQRAAELVADARGVTLAEAFHDEEDGLSPASHALARYFDLRAASIYSGSSEIHRNLIARQLVG